MARKEITPQAYAKIYGCSVQYIHRLLKEEKISLLPNVLSVKKYSRFYVLIVPFEFSADSFIQLKPKRGKQKLSPDT